MESFVQMSLREYDILKFGSENLKRELKEEQESHIKDIEQFNEAMNELYSNIDLYKQYILEYRCKWLDVENYSLESYLNIDSWNYGMNYKDELLSIGFTKQEMDEFIVKKYEEYLKDKQEDEEDVRYEYLKLYVETIEIYMRENELFEMFIESLKYAKTGERKWMIKNWKKA